MTSTAQADQNTTTSKVWKSTPGTKEEENMNRNDLMKYLRSVCGAERGIEFCRDAIATIDGELNGLHTPEPRQHSYQEYKHSATNSSAKANQKVSSTGSGICMTLAGAFFILCVVEMGGFWGVVCGFFGGFIIWAITAAVVAPVTAAVNYSNTKTEQKRQYEAGKEEYRISMERYHARLILDQKVREKLNRRKQELSLRQKNLESKARALYDLGILYAPFRNPAAASQILAYLEMGIADGLEGSSGAYAQYMQDVRVGRICGELNQLRTEVRAGFCKFENVIVGEMRSIRNQLDEYSATFKEEMNRMAQRIDSASENISQVADRCVCSLDTLNLSVRTMAWNQYIGQCETLADSFRYYQPR